MKKIYAKLYTSKLFLFALLAWFGMSNSSCTTEAYYAPTSGSYTGTANYCQGATASANTFTYNQCLSGDESGFTVDYYGVSGGTLQWYFNTTGSTSPGSSTAYGAAAGFTSPAGGTGTIAFTPATGTIGVFYYFAYITWPTTNYCTTSYTTPARTITITGAPGAITGATSLCMGSPVTLADPVTGGTWTSSATGTATIGLSTGIVTPVAAGTTTITYTTGTGCYVTRTETVNALPGLFSVSGGGSYCSGGTGVSIGLGGSASGISYQLYNGASLAGSAVGGTGSAISFGTYTAAGTYTVMATNATTGCQRAMTGSASIVINPAPAAITGTPVLCVGTTATLSDATSGGTWTSGSGSVSIGASTGIITGVSAGTSLISYTVSGGCAATIIATVNGTPTITGNAPVCVGSTITLSGPGAGTWISGTTANATIDAGGVVTGVATGTTIVTYTQPPGCTNTVTVTVNAAVPAITGTTSVCIGLMTTLSDATAGGTWGSSAGGVATIGTSDGVVTGGTAGTTTITYTVSIGCNTTTTVTVNPLPLAITGTAEVCEGLTTTLSDATTGGTWSSGSTGTATIGVSSGIVTGGIAGTAIITYTAGTSCIATRIVTVDPLPGAITGTLQVCIGLTTSLADPATGGTWISGNTGVATVGLSTGVVTGGTAGTTIITYTLPTGCLIKATVTVNPLPVAITGTAVVCVSHTTTLSDATGGGTWTSANTGIASVGLGTGIVTGTGGGTTTITYTTGTGCFATTTVTVNTLPSTILGAAGVCLGTTVTLTDGTTGGTWTSSNSAVAPIGSSSGIVTGSTVGTVNITYTLLSTGCYVTRPETVNPLPAAITGPSAVCAAGATITLSDATSGGTWTSSNTGIATVGLSTGIVTGVATGPVTITYKLSATGCVATKLLTVNPVPASVITPIGDTTFCPGGFVALTATTGTGLTYVWYQDGGIMPGAGSSSIITYTGGVYQVKVTNTLGCPTSSIPMTVTVDVPLATILVSGGGPAVTCDGTALTLDANTGAGLSYQWLQDGSPITTGGTGSSYAVTVSGTYAVIVTNSTGCSATSADMEVVVNPTPLANITLSGGLTFCQGDSVALHVSTGAGYTYQWHSTTMGAIPGATGSSYTATAADNYWVVVSNTYGCSATSVTSIVVVNPLPNVAITPSGPTIFCAGGNVTLSAAAGSYTYQWYSGGVLIPGATGANYLAMVSGHYRVRVTNTLTGCADKTHGDTIVTVTAIPVVVPLTPTAFCWGGSALLSTSVSGATGGVIYQWYKDGTAIPGAVSNTYNATVPGNYKCDVNIIGSCFTTTANVVVTENPLPNPVVTFDGSIFHAQTYYTSWQWYKDLVLIPGATSSSTPATANGAYKVAVTDTNGCQSLSAAYVLTGWTGSSHPSGVTTVNSDDILIYPNPASNILHIESSKNVVISIRSIDGRIVMDNMTIKDINVSRLVDGVYTVMIFDEQGVLLKVAKLVKNGN